MSQHESDMESLDLGEPTPAADAASFEQAAAAAAQSPETADDLPPPGMEMDELRDVGTERFYHPNFNVQMDSKSFSEAKHRVEYGRLALPGWVAKDLVDRYTELGTIQTEWLQHELTEKQFEAIPKDLQQHVLKLRGMMAAVMRHACYYGDELPTREGSLWTQGVQHDGVWLRTASNKLSSNADPVLRVSNALGLSGLYQFALWHSGIWLTVTSPQDAEWLELERRLAVDKVNLGRESNGRVFSAHEIYTMDIVIDFILDHVHSSTAPKSDRQTLREIIKISDIPLMIAGMISAQYPHGYPFSQPCLADPVNCNHVVEQLISLSKIIWVDSNMLTEKQRKHMAQRSTLQTFDSIAYYQKEFSWKVDSFLKLDERSTLQFDIPTLKEYQDSGYRWIAEIAERTNRAFGLTLQGEQREEYMRQWAKFDSLRQYSHYFKAVVTTVGPDGKTEEVTIESAEQLDRVISQLGSRHDFQRKVSEKILEFIDGTTIAMVAIPKEPCPACGKTPPEEYLKHPNLIPLDVAQVFFTLSAQRVSTIVMRQDLL